MNHPLSHPQPWVTAGWFYLKPKNLNFTFVSSIKDRVIVLASTQRYKKKYVTTLLYKPIALHPVWDIKTFLDFLKSTNPARLKLNVFG